MGSGSLGCTVDAEQLLATMQKRRHRQPGRR